MSVCVCVYDEIKPNSSELKYQTKYKLKSKSKLKYKTKRKSSPKLLLSFSKRVIVAIKLIVQVITFANQCR